MITHAASRKHYYTVLLDRSLRQPLFSVPGPEQFWVFCNFPLQVPAEYDINGGA